MPDRICALSVDPIEKKPLFHVQPGTPVLSVAKAGCTLGCLHCQNAEISQRCPDEVPGRDLPPDRMGSEMLRAGCHWVAYTYTEPLAWSEFTRRACDAVCQTGGRNALVTSGYAEEGVVRELAPHIAAANVDLKAFSDRFYREVCGGALAPVLRTLEILHDAGVHVEITNLVIPGLNDGDSELTALCEWVRDHLGAETPVHFSRYVPRHRMPDRPATPVPTLVRARALGRKAGLLHVYVGNVSVADAADTMCAHCGALLVRRCGYEVLEQRVTPGGLCPLCSASVPGVWS